MYFSQLGHLEGVPQSYLGDLGSPWLLTTYPSPGMILQVPFFNSTLTPMTSLQISILGCPRSVSNSLVSGLFHPIYPMAHL